MKSSPLVQLLESFFVFFLFLIGAMFLIIGMEPERMWKLTEWLEASTSHCVWLGSSFIIAAVFLTIVLVRLYSSRILELKLYRSRGKVEVEPAILKNYVLQFWNSQTSFPAPTQVNIMAGGIISITAKAPFTAFAIAIEEEQKKMLLSFEKNLIDTLQRQFGYDEPVILRWILPGAESICIQDA